MLKYMKLSDIIIPVDYQAHPPVKCKMELCRNYLKEFDELDRKIVVSPDGVLLDGYVGYLVIQEAGWEGVYVYVHEAPPKQSYRNTATTYVAGTHGNQKREFWWRITAETKDANLAIPGNRAIVHTKYGHTPVTITQVVTSIEPPVQGSVKKVICCYPAHREELTEDE